MLDKLNVYLNQICVGRLGIDGQGDMRFQYLPEYVQNRKNTPLSQSLPLQLEAFSAKQSRPFFSGILPEAHMRVSISRYLGISEKNDFALLDAIGGDCAGAVSLLPTTSKIMEIDSGYRIIDDASLSHILTTMHQRPMIVGEDGIRLSLAGAQDKLPVAVIDEKMALPIGNAPSTHILKPINKDFLSLIENECFCLHLARKVGLEVADACLQEANGISYLLVKRYDRVTQNNKTQRLHQEDFCQAMGIIPEMKYQREGGPGLKQCFDLLRTVSTLPVLDIKMLVKGVLFNLMIGNNDAHGKNFSLLYHDGQIRLAPFYDLIATSYYPALATKMAMKIGSKYEFKSLFPRHLIQMADEASLSKSLVKKEAMAMIERIEKQITESPFTPGIMTRVSLLKQRLLS